MSSHHDKRLALLTAIRDACDQFELTTHASFKLENIATLTELLFTAHVEPSSYNLSELRQCASKMVEHLTQSTEGSKQ